MVEFGTKLVEGCSPDWHGVCSEESLFKDYIYASIHSLEACKGLVTGERGFWI